MASNAPNGGGDRFDPPKTPSVVMKSSSEGALQPDTEENVIRETDSIFRNFVVNMQTIERNSEGADNTPNCPEITAFVDPPFA